MVGTLGNVTDYRVSAVSAIAVSLAIYGEAIAQPMKYKLGTETKLWIRK